MLEEQYDLRLLLVARLFGPPSILAKYHLESLIGQPSFEFLQAKVSRWGGHGALTIDSYFTELHFRLEIVNH